MEEVAQGCQKKFMKSRQNVSKKSPNFFMYNEHALACQKNFMTLPPLVKKFFHESY